MENDDIAEQLVNGNTGSKLQVILGGGLSNFHDRFEMDENGNFGSRTDRKNLIKEWLRKKEPEKHRTYVTNKVNILCTSFNGFCNKIKKNQFFIQDDLMSIVPSVNTSVLGLFGRSHLRYTHEINGISHKIPTLKEMTMKAIDILSTNPNGFFLFVENGLIDHAAHDSHAHIAFEETAELSRAVKTATKMLNTNDTLFVVLSDHSNTLTLADNPVSDFSFHSKKIRVFW